MAIQPFIDCILSVVRSLNLKSGLLGHYDVYLSNKKGRILI